MEEALLYFYSLIFIFTSIVPILELASSDRSSAGRGTEERIRRTECSKFSVPGMKTWKETLWSEKKTVRKSSLLKFVDMKNREPVYYGKRSNINWLLIPANYLPNNISLHCGLCFHRQCLLHASDWFTSMEDVEDLSGLDMFKLCSLGCLANCFLELIQNSLQMKVFMY